METIKRFLPSPEQSFFLLGPRGTGKSTWTKLQFPDAVFIDLLLPDTYRSLNANPEKLIQIVEGNNHKKVFVIDEIQKIPALLDVVHFLVEKDKKYLFVLTGSSARKLKKAGIDLLAGRALKYTCSTFMPSELNDMFDMTHSLEFGLLPVVLSSSVHQETLKSYIGLYLQEEIMQEGLVRDIGGFARFLEIISFSHAELINISNIARECEVKRKTVEGYVNILKDLMLAFTVPVFTKKASRMLSRHPKFYLFDTGVYRALRPAGMLDKPEKIAGGALEGLVAQNIKTWISYTSGKNELFFWRTKSGLEVDFIIYGEHVFAAVEVKSAKKIKPEYLRGLKAFCSDYPQAKAILLYCGEQRLKIDGVLCLPCREFLLGLKPDEFAFD